MNPIMADQQHGAPAPKAPETSGEAASNGANEEVAKKVADYESFFEGISPLLSKLDANPKLVEAIIADKISPEYAEAALKGELSVKEAQAATAATEAVKREVGEKAFSKMSDDELAKLIDAKVSEQTTAIKNELNDREEMKEFQSYTNEFISSTPDFQNYAEAISAWLDDHDVTDIRVAYYAVKGELTEKEAREAADKAAADNAKNVLLNAGGGGISSSALIEDKNVIDSLIAPRSSPNRI